MIYPNSSVKGTKADSLDMAGQKEFTRGPKRAKKQFSYQVRRLFTLARPVAIFFVVNEIVLATAQNKPIEAARLITVTSVDTH